MFFYLKFITDLNLRCSSWPPDAQRRPSSTISSPLSSHISSHISSPLTSLLSPLLSSLLSHLLTSLLTSPLLSSHLTYLLSPLTSLLSHLFSHLLSSHLTYLLTSLLSPPHLLSCPLLSYHLTSSPISSGRTVPTSTLVLQTSLWQRRPELTWRPPARCGVCMRSGSKASRRRPRRTGSPSGGRRGVGLRPAVWTSIISNGPGCVPGARRMRLRSSCLRGMTA